MPWKVCKPMDERLKFVARLLDGEKMAGLCREFGILRKTGYKIQARYNACGLEALTDRSRRPYRQANQLPMQIEKLIVRLKQDKPAWGAPKIRERLRRLHPDVHLPAISTVHAVLDRHGLVKRRGNARTTEIASLDHQARKTRIFRIRDSFARARILANLGKAPEFARQFRLT